MYEAIVFVASLREKSPRSSGRLIIAEPQLGALWRKDPTINSPEVKALLLKLGAEIIPLENKHFGQAYPHGNKIEALSILPADEPFVFFDTDTLITGELTDIPFDLNVPSASRRVTGTWPKEELYWPGYAATWMSLHDKFCP